jgi:peptide/nickel transport system permease protein
MRAPVADLGAATWTGDVRRRVLVSSIRSRRDVADLVGVGLFGAVTLVALLAPALEPHSPLFPVGPPDLPPSLHYWLGTDSIGRDLTSRVLAGVRITWFSSLVVIASGVLIGSAIGLTAGATGGLVDTLLMRLTDLFLALPGPIVAIAIVAALGPSLLHVLIGVSIVWWPSYARVVRGEVRSFAARPHYERARLSGIGPLRRTLRHLVPGVLPPVIVTASLDVGNLILTLAALSFLGLGAPAPAPELGAMAAQSLPYLLQQWWTVVMPGGAILVLALTSNIAGDSLRRLFKDR